MKEAWQTIHMGTAQLETPRLILRRYRMEDAEAIFDSWASDPVAARFWSWQPHENIGVTRNMLKIWTDEYQKAAYYHWAIVYRENQRPIGYIYLDSVDDARESAAVHYLISRSYWNRGLMTEGCGRVLEFAFEGVGFARIYSRHHRDNPASGRVMEKCGMRRTHAEYRKLEPDRLSGEYIFYEILKKDYHIKTGQ